MPVNRLSVGKTGFVGLPAAVPIHRADSGGLVLARRVVGGAAPGGAVPARQAPAGWSPVGRPQRGGLPAGLSRN